jgi:serine/threonine protein kinase
MNAGTEELLPADPRQLGPYRLVGRLGRGGMGTVYLAETENGEQAAVKVINPELAHDSLFRDRFRREVDSARRVRRFCTAPVLDANLEGDQLYIVTDYVNGPSLDDFIGGNGPMHGANLEHLAVGVATALTAIHSAGVVHRDLKPANVLLSSMGPRVIDFGIARALDSLAQATRTGQFVGTPAYMAPEVIMGETTTAAADVFAWGAVVAYAGTGRAPFGAPTVPAIFYNVTQGAPQLDGLDPAMRPLVERALDKDPAQRPTAQQLLDGLVGQTQADTAQVTETIRQSWPGEMITRTLPAPPPSAPKSPLDRVPGGLKTVAAAVTTVVVLTVVGVSVPGGSDGPPTGTASVYGDDFSNNGSGWDGGTFFSGDGYLNGKYRMETDTMTQVRYVSPPSKATLPTRLLIKATVDFVAGPAYGQAGVYCRSGDSSGYEFRVRHDGKGVVLRKTGKTLGSKDLVTTADAPGLKAQGPNLLEMACEEQDQGRKIRLRLWLNGQSAADYTDTDSVVPNGGAGLLVSRDGGSDSDKVVVDYSNFELDRITS